MIDTYFLGRNWRKCSTSNQGLNFYGIEIDSEKDAANVSIISREEAPVVVRVMPTDEELIIAQGLKELLSSS